MNSERGLFFLGQNTLYRDARQCIMRYLSKIDFELVMMAHGCERKFGPNDSKFISHCVEHDYVHLLQWNKTLSVDEITSYEAVKFGAFKCLKHLQPNFTSLDKAYVAKNAAGCGQLDILKWIFPFVPKSCLHKIMDEAIGFGHVHCMEYIDKQRTVDWNRNFHGWRVASSKGRLNALIWGEERGFRINIRECGEWSGSLAVLQWFMQRGFDPTQGIDMNFVIGRGQLDAVQFLIALGCTLTVDYMVQAALKNRVYILQCLYDAGCPFDETVCSYAAHTGSLEAFIWAMNHGMPRSEIVCNLAAACGRLEILRVAREHNCPMDLQKMWQLAKDRKTRNLIQSWMN